MKLRIKQCLKKDSLATALRRFYCFLPGATSLLLLRLGWATSAAISRDLLESFTQQILGERVF
jgi:hypothetical protein